MQAMSIQRELERKAVLKVSYSLLSKIPWALPARWTGHLIEIGCQERLTKTWEEKKGIIATTSMGSRYCHLSLQQTIKRYACLTSSNLERMLSFWPNCPCLPFVLFHSIWLGVWLRIWLGVWLRIWLGVWCKPSQTSSFLCLLINSRAHGQPKSEKQQKVGLNTCLIKLPMIWGISYIIAAKRVIETSLPYPFVSAPLISLSPLICV